MTECSRTKKNVHVCIYLSTTKVGKLKNLSKSKWEMAKTGIVILPQKLLKDLLLVSAQLVSEVLI